MFEKRIGSRAEVMHGVAEMTSGGLKKSKLGYSKTGEIVSLQKQKQAKDMKKNPLKGYIKLAKTTKGGEFMRMPPGGLPKSTLTKITKKAKK
jgi:hypothetical protein